jgi:hypothetical protein
MVLSRKKNRIYTHRKKQNKKRTQKAGCNLPYFPDGDDVWERVNGIISGDFYSVLQFYGFIDWTKCNQMYSLRNKKKNAESLRATIEGLLTQIFKGYVIYDATGQITNSPSPSLLFGSVKIDLERKKVILIQSQGDIAESSPLTFEFDYNKPINVIITPSPKYNKSKFPMIQNKSIFFFANSDATFKLGFKAGWVMPHTYIKNTMLAQIKNRENNQSQKKQLTMGENQQKQIIHGEQHAIASTLVFPPTIIKSAKKNL